MGTARLPVRRLANIGLPTDVTITRIEGATLHGVRPRVVGLNARLGVHGQDVAEPIVRLRTDAGVEGWGWSAAEPDHAHQLLGRKLHEVFDPQAGTDDAFLRFDFPLWDLAGRVLGKSVHEMLGDAGCCRVPIYDGSIYIDEIDPDTGHDLGLQPVLDAVRMGLDAGFHAFKVKIGRGYQWMEQEAGLKRDIELLHAIRGLIGDEKKLLIDANNGYSPDGARELMRGVGDCDIHWFEEPFPETIEDCLAFKQFIADSGWSTLLADGEGAAGRKPEFTEIVRAGGVDVVQFDMRTYTLSQWQRYLAVIAEAGVLAAPHNWASHLSIFYIAQFGRGSPHFAMGETDAMSMPAVIAEGYDLVDGLLRVPDAPGFGLELDEAALADTRNDDDRDWVIEES